MGRPYLYTQCAAADARRVFACFEQPDLKARFTWDVIAPAGWELVSNCATPEPTAVGPGLARWVFPETPPLPTYLAALCAGPFHAVRSEYAGPHGTYPLGVFARASMAEHLDAEEILEITRSGLAHYEREFVVPYPFGKYDQVFVPEFNFGAMENPGVVTFREDGYLYRSRVTEAARESRAMVIMHEMAHMWFGDLVTMRWWDDLWLNESFANWAGYGVAASATRFTGAWTTFALSQKAWAYVQDQLPSTHPVVADIPELEGMFQNFDGITYAKGASVLKQLVAYVGYDAFLVGVNRYFERHAWGNATLADLLVELEAASGRDLAAWARVWLQEPGVTTLQAHVERDAQGRYASVRIEQLPATRPAGVSQVLRPHRVALGLYRWADVDGARRLVREARIEVDVPDAVADVPELVGVPAADLLLVNDDDLTYAKVRLDPASMATARAGVGDLAESLPRALVWGALWEQVRDLAMPAQEFIDVALTGLAHEDRPGIIDTVRGLMLQASARFVAPALRADVARRMCAGTAAMLDAAEPGSDRQLALARLHIESATEPQRLTRLGDLLAGRVEIPGLATGGRPPLGCGDPVRSPGRGGRGADHRRARSGSHNPGSPVRRSGACSCAQRAGEGGCLDSRRGGWAVQHGVGRHPRRVRPPEHPGPPARPLPTALRRADPGPVRHPLAGGGAGPCSWAVPVDRPGDRAGRRWAPRRRPAGGIAPGRVGASRRRAVGAGLPGGVARGGVRRGNESSMGCVEMVDDASTTYRGHHEPPA